MLTKRRQGFWQLIVMVVLALVLAGCSRPGAGQDLPDVGGDPGVGGGEEPTPAGFGDLIAEGLTATAQAAEQFFEQPTEDPLSGELPPENVFEEPTALPPLDQPLPTLAPEPPVASGLPTVYTVQPGDWIYQIARNFGVSPQEIINANPGINPNFIVPGQQLNIPAPGGGVGAPETGGGAGPTSHTVSMGENLFRISRLYGRTYQDVAAANGIGAPYVIYPGQVLTIP